MNVDKILQALLHNEGIYRLQVLYVGVHVGITTSFNSVQPQQGQIKELD